MIERMKHQPNIVVIGGGTGSFTLLQGLKQYTSNITALVNMSDDGGSTGVLRDELGVLPPGDVRQCLVALSDENKVRKLFSYRFSEGSLDGHSFGNLFISTVEKMTDSMEEAIAAAGKVLRITGTVLPITLDKITLIATTKKGTKIVGQHKVGCVKLEDQRPLLKLEPGANINPKAKKAIKNADIVVIAPGNLNGSLAPALIVDGVGTALVNTKAKVIVITNLVTKPGQTDGFGVSDYMEEIERFCGKKDIADYVIFNTDEPTKQMLDQYTQDGELIVEFDLERMEHKNFHPVGQPLIDKSPVDHNPSDKIAHKRSLIRHDSDVVAREIMKIYFS